MKIANENEKQRQFTLLDLLVVVALAGLVAIGVMFSVSGCSSADIVKDNRAEIEGRLAGLTEFELAKLKYVTLAARYEDQRVKLVELRTAGKMTAEEWELFTTIQQSAAATSAIMRTMREQWARSAAEGQPKKPDGWDDEFYDLVGQVYTTEMLVRQVEGRE